MWIGVDLDGTLAVHESGQLEIGAPVEAMRSRVLAWREQGLEVRIFTTRACDPEQKKAVTDWLALHGMEGLAVTNVKESGMIEMWDDRAVQVEKNTGRALNLTTPLTRMQTSRILRRPFVPLHKFRK